MTQEKPSNTLALLLVKNPKNLSTFSLSCGCKTQQKTIYSSSPRQAQGMPRQAWPSAQHHQTQQQLRLAQRGAAPRVATSPKHVFCIH
ncbi:hypothetical protein A2U01_0078161 [Trifolium medium]|uniref:Uncharacterized protein n=1 Tax=Trifolium medium TaxID=97028 RepID=A0A392T9Q6_9FABA|nr:hypothetical protein [Trifolium medium]